MSTIFKALFLRLGLGIWLGHRYSPILESRTLAVFILPLVVGHSDKIHLPIRNSSLFSSSAWGPHLVRMYPSWVFKVCNKNLTWSFHESTPGVTDRVSLSVIGILISWVLQALLYRTIGLIDSIVNWVEKWRCCWMVLCIEEPESFYPPGLPPALTFSAMNLARKVPLSILRITTLLRMHQIPERCGGGSSTGWITKSFAPLCSEDLFRYNYQMNVQIPFATQNRNLLADIVIQQ